MLTPEWFPLKPHPIQSALYRSRDKFCVVVAGRGSGKTLLARRRIVRMLSVRKSWHDPQYFYALPTVQQAKRVAWGKLKALIPSDWIARPRDINETELTIKTIFGSTLHVLGMDKPHRAEGLQYDGGVIDEASDQKPKVFATTFLPALTDRDGFCWQIGVPKRHGTGAKDFKEFYERGVKNEPIPGTELRLKSFTWPSADIISANALEFARHTLDPKDFAEHYGGVFQNSGGGIFYAFSDSNVSSTVAYNPALPLIVGSDFNVSPMAWVVCQKIGNELHVFDEIWLRDTNTQATLNELYKRYGQHKSGFRFIGDATGRARKTSASTAAQSDYLIIRADRRFVGMQIEYPKSNPAVVDRFASCNAMLQSAAGTRRLLIHPRCVKLLADLEQRAYIDGTREPDDWGDIGHITDALGYVVHRLFPISISSNAEISISA